MKKKPLKKQAQTGQEGSRGFPLCGEALPLRSPCCAIMDSISDGVFTIDHSKRITNFNRAAEEITGFSADDAVGQYCFDVFRADICERHCALQETLSGGRPEINLQARIITREGIEKPISISTAVLKDEKGNIIGGVETFRDLSELEDLRRQVSRGYTREDIVGTHALMKEILSFLPDIAESESPVLIEGPTGSGKELIARAIHNQSPRREKPFIPVNCAALPDTLLESELFGYVKGAFTGALRDKPGRFLSAHGGTLFLDEISNTSTLFQADLLRVLQDGEFTPLGGTKPRRADVRVVAASNIALSTLVHKDRFREDLYYRLNVVRIALPALRERRLDIPLLVEHFIHKLNLKKARDIRGVSPDVMNLLLAHPFPGNVRELENIIEYAFITCKGHMIHKEHLPADLIEESMNRDDRISQQELSESDRIRAVLLDNHGNRIEAARSLNMSRTTLWRKMRRYGIDDPRNET